MHNYVAKVSYVVGRAEQRCLGLEERSSSDLQIRLKQVNEGASKRERERDRKVESAGTNHTQVRKCNKTVKELMHLHILARPWLVGGVAGAAGGRSQREILSTHPREGRLACESVNEIFHSMRAGK